MSKHFGKFATEAQYTAGLSSLDFPNVSLVEQTGNIHYTVPFGPKELFDASFGSICMEEQSSGYLFTINSDEYNLTSYPIDDYKPIAVCIFPMSETSHRHAVFMSTRWLTYTAGQSSANSTTMVFGFRDNDLSSYVSDIRSTTVDSKTLNNSIRTSGAITVNWSGNTIPNDFTKGSLPGFEASWRYHTIGTNEGDWYLPSYYDLTKLKDNYSTITDVLTIIKNVAGTSFLNTVMATMQVAKEVNETYVSCFNNGNFTTNASKYYNTGSVRPVFYAGPEEI